MSSLVSLEVNGRHRQLVAATAQPLVTALRDGLGLTGAGRGCGDGSCGACTVLVDGEPVLSCLVPVETVEGRSIRTIEGESNGNELSPMQQSFVDHYATQCGFCTSGMIMAATALIERNPTPDRRDVAEAICGNVCRCTGYEPIINAVVATTVEEPKRVEPTVEPAIDHSYFAGENGDHLHVVGSSTPRGDAVAHVTGQTEYFEDLRFRDPTELLHLKMCRSDRHHALIRDIDASAAMAVPGVVRVLTHVDVPENWYTILRLIGVEPNDEPVLAEGRVLFRGEQVCAVLAESEAAAIEGASKVRIDYDDLPPVFDVEEALLPDTIKIKPHGENHFVYEGHHCRRIRFGDVDDAFASADHVVDRTYQSAPIEHAPTEPTGCIVVPGADGRLTIHSDTQACFFTLDNTALIMDEPFQRFRLIGGTVGGGFGGKVDVITEPIACIAANLTGRPVKYVYNRAEEMQVSSPRAAERIRIEDGVMADGRIIARKVTIHVDAGAYSRHSPYGTTKAAAHMPGPYSVPNVWVDAHCVYTNRTPSSAMRGFGVTIADFAIESQMDELARLLDIDPVEFRLINAYRDGDMKAHRKIVEGAALIEVLQKTAELTGTALDDRSMVMSSTSRGGE